MTCANAVEVPPDINTEQAPPEYRSSGEKTAAEPVADVQGAARRKGMRLLRAQVLKRRDEEHPREPGT
jgi:hypothetical protein